VDATDLRPRTIGELLDASFTVYRRAFVRLVLVATVVSVPSMLVATIWAGAAADAMRSYVAILEDMVRHPSQDATKAVEAMFSAVGKILPISLLGNLLQAVSRGASAVAMALAASAAIRREPMPSARDMLRTALPRMPAAVLAQLFLDFAWSSLMCCCLVPGIVAFVLLVAAPAAIALEVGPSERALEAAAARGGALRTFAWLLRPVVAAVDGLIRSATLCFTGAAIARGTVFTFFLFLFVSVFLGVVVFATSAATGSDASWFWAQHYAEVLFLPVLGLGRALWYFDLVARREGADLAPTA
jgi:hypothetical protein